MSVDEAEDSRELARELEIPFPLLADRDLRAAVAYGVAMEGKHLAVPAVFVIRRDRRIAWRQVGESIAERPAPEELLRVVRRLKGQEG